MAETSKIFIENRKDNGWSAAVSVDVKKIVYKEDDKVVIDRPISDISYVKVLSKIGKIKVAFSDNTELKLDYVGTKFFLYPQAGSLVRLRKAIKDTGLMNHLQLLSNNGVKIKKPFLQMFDIETFTLSTLSQLLLVTLNMLQAIAIVILPIAILGNITGAGSRNGETNTTELAIELGLATLILMHFLVYKTTGYSTTSYAFRNKLPVALFGVAIIAFLLVALF